MNEWMGETLSMIFQTNSIGSYDFRSNSMNFHLNIIRTWTFRLNRQILVDGFSSKIIELVVWIKLLLPSAQVSMKFYQNAKDPIVIDLIDLIATDLRAHATTIWMIYSNASSGENWSPDKTNKIPMLHTARFHEYAQNLAVAASLRCNLPTAQFHTLRRKTYSNAIIAWKKTPYNHRIIHFQIDAHCIVPLRIHESSSSPRMLHHRQPVKQTNEQTKRKNKKQFITRKLLWIGNFITTITHT